MAPVEAINVPEMVAADTFASIESPVFVMLVAVTPASVEVLVTLSPPVDVRDEALNVPAVVFPSVVAPAVSNPFDRVIPPIEFEEVEGELKRT